MRQARQAVGCQAEVLSQYGRRCVGEPVRDAEGAELGELAVVESENEMTLAGTQTLDGVRVPFGEIPCVAGTEVGDIRLRRAALTIGRVDGDAASSFHDIRPLGGNSVPVQFTGPAGC